MAIIETKYSVGDSVYKGDASYEYKYIECPDCLGTKIVHITFADKRIEILDCYTCRTYGFGQHSTGTLDYQEWVPRVRKGTIISVELSDGKTKYKVNYGMYVYNGASHEDINYNTEEEIYFEKEKALTDALEAAERHNACTLADLFKKKGSFAKRIQDSHLRYDRQNALEAEREMNRWVKMIKGRKDAKCSTQK